MRWDIYVTVVYVQTGLLHDTGLGVGTHTRAPPEEQSYLVMSLLSHIERHGIYYGG